MGVCVSIAHPAVHAGMNERGSYKGAEPGDADFTWKTAGHLAGSHQRSPLSGLLVQGLIRYLEKIGEKSPDAP